VQQPDPNSWRWGWEIYRNGQPLPARLRHGGHASENAAFRVVLDNLSTHFPGSLYQAFPPCEARRVLRRLEFHYVPKHASWLNMVESEIGVLRSQCLDRSTGVSQPRNNSCPKCGVTRLGGA
jgi:hypothetical protein